MKRTWIFAGVVFLLPAVVQAEPSVVLGVPLDGNSGSADTVAEAVTRALGGVEWELASPQKLNELLGRIGGVQRCDQTCLRKLAADLAPTKLITVSTSTGGGWTAATLAHQQADREVVLGATLFPDGSLDEVIPSLIARLGGAQGRLAINGGPEGTEIYVDAKSVGPVPVAQPVELAPGRHLVRLGAGRSDGGMLAVTVRPGLDEHLDLTASLRAVDAFHVRKVWWKRPWVWGLAAGAVSIVGASAFAATDGFGTLEPGQTTVIVRSW